MLTSFPEDTPDGAREFMARLTHFAWLSPQEQLAVIDAQGRALTRHRQRVAALASARAERWSRLALDRGLAIIDSELVWLAGIRADVENAAAQADGDPTGTAS